MKDDIVCELMQIACDIFKGIDLPNHLNRENACLRPYSHETFLCTILKLKDIFKPWIYKGQGKL